MKHTLLIRLQGPMQAWGVQSRFSVRDTAREPTKSGVIGLLCSALGRPRTAPLDNLLSLRMGVRVDQEGELMVDYQTARNVLNAEGKVLKNAVLSNRYYLANAIFLVGLESADLGLLENLQAVLKQPEWLLCLGRKSFPLSAPAWLKNGLCQNETLEAALEPYPWLVRRPKNDWETKKLPQQLRLVYEQESGQGAISRQDQPLSFANRNFARRRFDILFCNPPGAFLNENEGG
jgi:CRISPR system Cascade subunit CasD